MTKARVKKRVLIAEDNPDLRAIFARVFDRQYFAVTLAVDGLEAMDHLNEEMPDVLILDVNMPRLSGLQVLSRIRQRQEMKGLKVIVVTGNSLAMQHPDAAFADLFLVKPVNIMELVTLAQRLTGE
jgi:DNA-binding response OmpR family regulator